jgi:hypothetical protein
MLDAGVVRRMPIVPSAPKQCESFSIFLVHAGPDGDGLRSRFFDVPDNCFRGIGARL